MNTKILSIFVFATVIATGGASLAQAQTCTNASLKGTYGFHGFATIVPPSGPTTPRAIIGVFTLDGRGNWTANLTLDDNGMIIPKPNQGGSYIVNADCTGALFPSASGGSGAVAIVVVDGGREFYQMRTDPASIVLFGTTKKVTSADSGDNGNN
jgi:hypothetical protein